MTDEDSRPCTTESASNCCNAARCIGPRKSGLCPYAEGLAHEKMRVNIAVNKCLGRDYIGADTSNTSALPIVRSVHRGNLRMTIF